MATTPELHEPQIAAARAQAWHQAGDSLLTLEAARGFLNEHGLLLFAPRPLGAPAPSLVEATLGSAKPQTTAADAGIARGLAARLVAEGSAVPLNLLGGPGDLPDFLVSASAFPFVFTLRGDKGWKRPPETSGAVKVTPLALRVYELLGERGAMTVAEIVSEAGREVTDSAISRSLNELWSLLRVIPTLQQGEGETSWELTTARFVKAVKAGANAGQPTALSALVSLYLGQAFIASEEEIASFLSPLTARSRVREVLHGLTAGRQLGEAVLEGKAVLYIPEALPDFAQFAPAEETAEAETGEAETTSRGEQAPGEGEGRIKRFEAAGDGRSGGRTLRGKPTAREGGARPAARSSARPAPRSGFGAGPRAGAGRPRSAERGERPVRDRAAGGFGARPARPAGASDRGRGATADRPSFTRPWDEERASRPPRGDRPATGERAGGGAEERRPPRREGTGEKRPYVRREGTGERRPYTPREGAGEKRPYVRREGAGEGRPFKRAQGAGERRPYTPREGSAERRPYTPREGAGERRPYKRAEGAGERRSYTPREGAAEKRPYTRREGSGEAKPFVRRERPGGERPFVRREGGEGARSAPRSRPFPPELREGAPTSRPERGAPRGDRPERTGEGRPFVKKSFAKSTFPRSAGAPGGRPRGGPRPDRGGPEARPGRAGQGGPARGGQNRPAFRSGPGEGRAFGDRSVRGGAPQRGRPQGHPGDRQGPRPGGARPGAARGGFGGARKGPAKGPARGPRTDRPGPRPRPEDGA